MLRMHPQELRDFLGRQQSGGAGHGTCVMADRRATSIRAAKASHSIFWYFITSYSCTFMLVPRSHAAFEEVARLFQARNPGVEMNCTFGASGTFFAQIANGAPFDFLSADAEYRRGSPLPIRRWLRTGVQPSQPWRRRASARRWTTDSGGGLR